MISGLASKPVFQMACGRSEIGHNRFGYNFRLDSLPCVYCLPKVPDLALQDGTHLCRHIVMDCRGDRFGFATERDGESAYAFSSKSPVGFCR